MSGSNDGSGSWGSRFLKVPSAVAAATAAVAGGLYALLSSSSASDQDDDDLSSYDDDDLSSDPESTPLMLQIHTGDRLVWKTPEIGWVKLNVDGSLDHHKNVSAGCGGVLRDASGEWLYGFAQKLNHIYAYPQTELHAILKGMELAWKVKLEKNIENLVVESDCGVALAMVTSSLMTNHPDYEVVERIRELCFNPNWQVKLVCISTTPYQGKNTKVNVVADRLTKDARDLPSYDLTEYPHPPNQTYIELLEKNKLGSISGSSEQDQEGETYSLKEALYDLKSIAGTFVDCITLG